MGGAGDSLVFPWDMSRNRITLFEYGQKCEKNVSLLRNFHGKYPPHVPAQLGFTLRGCIVSVDLVLLRIVQSERIQGPAVLWIQGSLLFLLSETTKTQIKIRLRLTMQSVAGDHYSAAVTQIAEFDELVTDVISNWSLVRPF